MRPTQALNGGGAPNWKAGHWLGDWGSFGGSKQKGIIHYGLSANRQNPTAGIVHDAFFNTFRRTKGQIFYWLPPLVAGYYLMQWATERNHYLQSKAGRAEFGDDAE
ncbi:ubiquinol--cytochrome-c reductase subunit 8 [Metarhizium acridum]|uniref:Cytochrome b-c1 complex subunit 8 n=1 Tax=Metarhizium acridum (strain CQMa 102) TaxID=655827 RepID=E9EH90_METAQ|nr:ubiquinol-cytochrome-C oxidoreductase complex III subunit VIII [Metarhizium acridum CQMa 102]EFY84719.1 ubiquinol-cytochrome-C oxidoreductase complex III subunit VIII [Metarhizium acridum CQMa 102]KAG8418415.1 ubiquinol--cytochrome-c reductase subunit 8 [Metarhizium acridum]KAG8428219.1 ubiquinol--cytochrome-c reductase subunit 8 [Metarhizium acridum]